MENNNFYDEIFKMKNILRRGWVNRGVKGKIESDAEHTMSMIWMALVFMSKNNLQLDQLKVVKMIAFHDLGEVDVGDIVPDDKIDPKTKHNKEQDCIKRLAKEYGLDEIERLWIEFEENKTPEAQFVKKLDKFDAILQSKAYYEQGLTSEKTFEEFFENHKEIADELSLLNF